jgi:hypothetical protein
VVAQPCECTKYHSSYTLFLGKEFVLKLFYYYLFIFIIVVLGIHCSREEVYKEKDKPVPGGSHQ